MFEKVLKANPNHHPAGSPKGGQFAPSKGKALDTYSLISGLSRKGVEVVDSKSDITRYIDDLNRIGEDTRGMGYIESEAEWNTILRNVYEETDRLKAEHGIDIRETRGMVILMRSNPHEGAGGVYERENQIIMVSGSDATHASSKEAEGFHSQNGMHWSVSAKAMYEEGKDAGIKATFRHELGHHFSLQRKSVYEAVTDNLMGSKYNPDWFAKNVTYYGAVSVEEMMAEVFAHATSPSYKPQSLPIEFERIVDAMKSPTKVSKAIKSAFSKDLLCPSRDAELDIPDTWVSSPFKRLEREPKVHMTGNVLKFNPNHDKLGRFAMTRAGLLNKRLVDFKPDRTLSDPSKVQAITDVLKGTEYVSYGDMPFIDRMHKNMGVKDPLTIPVNEYMTARDKLFNKQEKEQLRLKNLVVTQKVVNSARIAEKLSEHETETDSPIQAVEYKGKTYIINGHHRVVAAALRGDKTISARVLKMTTAKKFELVFKYNPNHEPAGSPKGGQFAKVNKVAGHLPPSNYVYKTADELISHALPNVADREAFNRAIAAHDFKAKDSKKIYSKNGDGTGGYTKERLAVHRLIIDRLLGGNLENLKPADGEQATLIILGGRGGSGKSNFDKEVNPKTGVYSRETSLVLDADHIKSLLPDYNPENAFMVHEESSDILLKAAHEARKMGLNVVLDVTLKSRGDKWLRTFKNYRVEAYYMHRPADLAALSAIQRWNKPSKRQDIHGEVHNYNKGRLVPPAIVLSNKNNEHNFDYLIPKVAKWAVWDNSNPANGQFKLYASGGK